MYCFMQTCFTMKWLELALRQTGDLSRVYPAARPMTAGIGSSTPRDPLRISGIEDDWLTDWNWLYSKTFIYVKPRRNSDGCEAVLVQWPEMLLKQVTWHGMCPGDLHNLPDTIITKDRAVKWWFFFLSDTNTMKLFLLWIFIIRIWSIRSNKIWKVLKSCTGQSFFWSSHSMFLVLGQLFHNVTSFLHLSS